MNEYLNEYLDEVSQALLVLQLDGPPLLLEGLVIGVLPQAGQLVGFGNPPIAAQGLGDQLAQAGVAVGQPPAGSHTIGLVLELLGGQLVEILSMYDHRSVCWIGTHAAIVCTCGAPDCL